MNTFTQTDMRGQLRIILDATAGTYDVSATLAALVREYGVVDLDTIPYADFWRVVAQNIQ